MTFHTARTALSCTALMAAIITGCAKSDLLPIGANDRFRPDDEARAVDNIFAQQRANAAREDGTFYPQHFTDGRLNGLGYAKLSAMSHGHNDKLAIYLDVPKGDAYTAAQDSVIKALARGGVAEKDYTITAGSNPNVGAPAADGQAALVKQKAAAAADGAAAAPADAEAAK